MGELNDKYKGLESIVCAYKLGDIDPGNNNDGLSLGVCAEICNEEAESARKWSSFERQSYHPMIISALHVIYPDKKAEWFKKPFLLSPKGSAIYWTRVLERRAQIWLAAEKAHKASEANMTTPVKSLAKRIRRKIKQREIQKTRPSPTYKSTSSKSLSFSSTDDSDTDGPAIAHADLANEDVPKLACAPETYTRGEVKHFKRMVHVIHNYDAAEGHTPATCDFVDMEFSDGSGILARARRSNASWKTNRVNKACEQAASILKDRYELTEPFEYASI